MDMIDTAVSGRKSQQQLDPWRRCGCCDLLVGRVLKQYQLRRRGRDQLQPRIRDAARLDPYIIWACGFSRIC